MRLLFALLLALLPLPALADVTARYAAGKTELIVAIDDGGNARIDFADKFSIIRRGGVDYAVIKEATGDTKVVNLADLMSLVSGMFSGVAMPEGQTPDKFVLTSRGDASIAGFAGTRWAFGPEREADGRPGEMLELVLSADPKLEPIGVLFQRIVGLAEPAMSVFAPPGSGFHLLALDLAAKGAPLGIGKTELQSVSYAKIDPKRFDLPAPPVSAAEFMAASGMPVTGTDIAPLP